MIRKQQELVRPLTPDQRKEAAFHNKDQIFLQVLQILTKNGFLLTQDIKCFEQTNKKWFVNIRKHKLFKKRIAYHGFLPTKRIRFWMIHAKVHDLMKKMPQKEISRFYLELAGILKFEEKASLDSTGVEGEIARDVVRTFPTHSFFQVSSGNNNSSSSSSTTSSTTTNAIGYDSKGQIELGNVLKVVSKYCPQVGYCQGMNYVCGVLLLYLNEDRQLSSMTSQETTFWFTLSLIEHFDMKELWRHQMPGLSRCIYLFTKLFSTQMPDLYQHFTRIGMHTSFFCTQWFITLFSRTFHSSILLRVWDLFFLDGWKMIYRIGLGILSMYKTRLLACQDMETSSVFFGRQIRVELENFMDVNELFVRAFSFKVTRKMLLQLEEQRHLEYLKLRLEKKKKKNTTTTPSLTLLSMENTILFPMLTQEQLDNNESNESEKTLELIRVQLKEMDTCMASDTMILRNKIEQVDKQLTEATTKFYQATYHLTEATFELEEHEEMLSHFVQQFDSLAQIAFKEILHHTKKNYRKFLLSPTSLQRLLACLENQKPSHKNSKKTIKKQDKWDEKFIEIEKDLELFQQVGSNSRNHNSHSSRITLFKEKTSIGSDLICIQKKFQMVKQSNIDLKQRFGKLQQNYQHAQMEVEEFSFFKDCLSDQFLQLLFENERKKDLKIQEFTWSPPIQSGVAEGEQKQNDEIKKSTTGSNTSNSRIVVSRMDESIIQEEMKSTSHLVEIDKQVESLLFELIDQVV